MEEAMEKGLGIAALVVAILGIFVPVVTIYVVWLALILAALAGFLGDKAFPIASLLVCLINILFLSPMTWAALASERIGGGYGLLVTTIILFIAPIAGLMIGAMKAKTVSRGGS
jgi:hypothetical protein